MEEQHLTPLKADKLITVKNKAVTAGFDDEFIADFAYNFIRYLNASVMANSCVVEKKSQKLIAKFKFPLVLDVAAGANEIFASMQFQKRVNSLLKVTPITICVMVGPEEKLLRVFGVKNVNRINNKQVLVTDLDFRIIRLKNTSQKTPTAIAVKKRQR